MPNVHLWLNMNMFVSIRLGALSSAHALLSCQLLLCGEDLHLSVCVSQSWPHEIDTHSDALTFVILINTSHVAHMHQFNSSSSQLDRRHVLGGNYRAKIQFAATYL